MNPTTTSSAAVASAEKAQLTLIIKKKTQEDQEILKLQNALENAKQDLNTNRQNVISKEETLKLAQSEYNNAIQSFKRSETNFTSAASELQRAQIEHAQTVKNLKEATEKAKAKYALTQAELDRIKAAHEESTELLKTTQQGYNIYTGVQEIPVDKTLVQSYLSAGKVPPNLPISSGLSTSSNLPISSGLPTSLGNGNGINTSNIPNISNISGTTIPTSSLETSIPTVAEVTGGCGFYGGANGYGYDNSYSYGGNYERNFGGGLSNFFGNLFGTNQQHENQNKQFQSSIKPGHIPIGTDLFSIVKNLHDFDEKNISVVNSNIMIFNTNRTKAILGFIKNNPREKFHLMRFKVKNEIDRLLEISDIRELRTITCSDERLNGYVYYFRDGTNVVIALCKAKEFVEFISSEALNGIRIQQSIQ